MEIQQIEQIIVFMATVGAATTVEHYTIGRRWKNNELARRAVGIATVMAASFPLTLTGTITVASWVVFMFGFLAAGTAKVGLTIRENERRRMLVKIESVLRQLDDSSPLE